MYRLQGRASDTQTGAGTHGHKLSHRHTNTQSHKQTDRKCDQETYLKKTEWKGGRLTNKLASRQTDSKTESEIEIETDSKPQD